jgi:hypothetical protein
LGEFSTIENDFTRALWAIAKLSGRISASVLQMYSQVTSGYTPNWKIE